MVLVESHGCEFKVRLVNMVVHFSLVILGCRQGAGGGWDWLGRLKGEPSKKRTK